MRLPLLAIACAWTLPGCSLLALRTEADSVRLGAWMTGSFTSAAQAAAAPDDYFDIRLYMEPIWPERDDGPWLYVEQAAASALERPYRQRVYHLIDTDEGVRSDVYALPDDPLEYAGAWRTPERFDALTPDLLVLREGCSIHLVEAGGVYVGATRGEGCQSSLGGASYATSEVRVEPELLTSWDRGWDAEGEQAWGAELGPYLFVREPRGG
ncbi:MAG: chromophore lyase CpcT/CpeT [Planctomycetota bacterium]